MEKFTQPVHQVPEDEGYDGVMRATCLVCTLKRAPQESNSESFAQVVLVVLPAAIQHPRPRYVDQIRVRQPNSFNTSRTTP
jgi:hypothetical protein